MINVYIRVCNIVVSLLINCSETKEYLKDYLVDECSEVCLGTILVERIDIEHEMKKSKNKNLKYYCYEINAVNRKLAEFLIDYNVLLIHGAAIAIDGYGYVFTARSGVGKTTHIKLYKEVFKDRVEIINGDKPYLFFKDNKIYVSGNPFDGKERLSTNKYVELKGIVFLNRGLVNSIEYLSSEESLFVLLRQVYKIDDKNKYEKVLKLIKTVIHNVEIYKLYCDKTIDAVYTSYDFITKTGKKL